jgi:TPP-dependent pyruvate/acetoin dehydrogenase alpha subunit
MIEPLRHLTISKIGQYNALSLDGITPDLGRHLLRQTLRLRRTEEALHEEYHPKDEMRCPVHFCIGQEAVPSALSQVVQPDDYMFSHHRSHGYFFAKGAPLSELFAEIYGKETGASGGKAGSQDISHSPSHFYSGAILAGAVSIAVGAAFGFQLRGSRQIAVSGFGEGATDEGAFWEAVAFAGKKKLPMLFVIENNRYATFSDQLKRQASDNICERVRPFGVRATQIFGNDAALAYRVLSGEADRLRHGDGPALVEAYTYRWNSHVGPEDDGANGYRTQEEMDFWKKNCPVLLLKRKLSEVQWIDEELWKRWETEIAEEIEDNFRFAKQSPFPEAIDWHRANLDFHSPLADQLLEEAEQGQYDQYQAEAKLGPY